MLCIVIEAEIEKKKKGDKVHVCVCVCIEKGLENKQTTKKQQNKDL